MKTQKKLLKFLPIRLDEILRKSTACVLKIQYPSLTETRFFNYPIIFQLTFTNTSLIKTASSSCCVLTDNYCLQMFLRRLRQAEHRRSSFIPSCRNRGELLGLSHLYLSWCHPGSPPVSLHLSFCLT